MKHIECIKAVSDRIMYLQLEHTTPTAIINCYCPQSGRPVEEKEEVYESIRQIANEHKGKGPVLIGGDFNARLQKPTDGDEKTIIGNHTFQSNTANVAEMTEDMLGNRHLLVELCKEQNMIAANTQFRKQENKLATYRKIGAERTNAPSRNDHEQIDYWIIGRRWMNMIKDAESDMTITRSN